MLGERVRFQVFENSNSPNLYAHHVVTIEDPSYLEGNVVERKDGYAVIVDDFGAMYRSCGRLGSVGDCVRFLVTPSGDAFGLRVVSSSREENTTPHRHASPEGVLPFVELDELDLGSHVSFSERLRAGFLEQIKCDLSSREYTDLLEQSLPDMVDLLCKRYNAMDVEIPGSPTRKKSSFANLKSIQLQETREVTAPTEIIVAFQGAASSSSASGMVSDSRADAATESSPVEPVTSPHSNHISSVEKTPSEILPASNPEPEKKANATQLSFADMVAGRDFVPKSSSNPSEQVKVDKPEEKTNNDEAPVVKKKRGIQLSDFVTGTVTSSVWEKEQFSHVLITPDDSDMEVIFRAKCSIGDRVRFKTGETASGTLAFKLIRLTSENPPPSPVQKVDRYADRMKEEYKPSDEVVVGVVDEVVWVHVKGGPQFSHILIKPDVPGPDVRYPTKIAGGKRVQYKTSVGPDGWLFAVDLTILEDDKDLPKKSASITQDSTTGIVLNEEFITGTIKKNVSAGRRAKVLVSRDDGGDDVIYSSGQFMPGTRIKFKVRSALVRDRREWHAYNVTRLPNQKSVAFVTGTVVKVKKGTDAPETPQKPAKSTILRDDNNSMVVFYSSEFEIGTPVKFRVEGSSSQSSRAKYQEATDVTKIPSTPLPQKNLPITSKYVPISQFYLNFISPNRGSLPKIKGTVTSYDPKTQHICIQSGDKSYELDSFQVFARNPITTLMPAEFWDEEGKACCCIIGPLIGIVTSVDLESDSATVYRLDDGFTLKLHADDFDGSLTAGDCISFSMNDGRLGDVTPSDELFGGAIAINQTSRGSVLLDSGALVPFTRSIRPFCAKRGDNVQVKLGVDDDFNITVTYMKVL